MKVAFVTPELDPLVRRTPLAEVAAALPYLPEPVKRATVGKMREWKAAAAQRGRHVGETEAALASA